MLNDILPAIGEIKLYKVQDLVLELEENDSTDLLISSKSSLIGTYLSEPFTQPPDLHLPEFLIS